MSVDNLRELKNAVLIHLATCMSSSNNCGYCNRKIFLSNHVFMITRYINYNGDDKILTIPLRSSKCSQLWDAIRIFAENLTCNRRDRYLLYLDRPCAIKSSKVSLYSLLLSELHGIEYIYKQFRLKLERLLVLDEHDKIVICLTSLFKATDISLVIVSFTLKPSYYYQLKKMKRY
jgi:hypothetical protein